MKTRIIQNEPEPAASPPSRAASPDQHRRANGALERAPPQEGDLRLARVRRSRSFAIGMACSPMKAIVFETSGPGESGRADTILYEDFKQPAGESVLIQSETLTASDPEFQATVQDVIAGVSTLDAVAKVESPLDPENSGQVSDDRKSVLVPMEIRGASDDAADKIDPVVARVKELQKAHPRVLRRLVRREHREGRPRRPSSTI